MLRVLVVLLALCCIARSEESSSGTESKSEAAHSGNQHANAPKQITVPANSSSPTIINIQSGKHAGQESHCSKPKDRTEWGLFAVCKADEWLDAERVIAGFTVILGIATWFLWRATVKLVKSAEKTSERQLRPYVFLSSAKIADAAGKPSIEIRIKNFGQTPAYGTVFWTEGILREYPLTSKLKRRTTSNSPKIDIGPEGAMHTTVDWDGPISETDRAALIAKSKAIYVFGKIEYRDTFGNSWMTEYQFMEGGEYPFRTGGGELPHTKDGNRAT